METVEGEEALEGEMVVGEILGVEEDHLVEDVDAIHEIHAVVDMVAEEDTDNLNKLTLNIL
jgi:hypothetical protein